MTVVIEGRLEYLGWRRPWSIATRGNKIDLSQDFWPIAARLKDQPASMEVRPDQFVVKADKGSPFAFTFNEVGGGALLQRREGFGFINAAAYCETILCNLNGREVIASIDDDKFLIIANPQEVVPSVRFHGEGNMARILPGSERTVCGVATGDACIFLTASAKGFECAKFSSVARTLIDRRAEGTMRATRIGNCRIDGREKSDGS